MNCDEITNKFGMACLGFLNSMMDMHILYTGNMEKVLSRSKLVACCAQVPNITVHA